MKGKKTGGRGAGTPNKLNAEVKEMIVEAFDNLGGVDWLVEKGNKYPVAFMTLLGKLLPYQLTGKDGEPLIKKYNVTIVRDTDRPKGD